MATDIEKFTNILNQYHCVNVRIEIKDDLPAVIGTDYTDSKKSLTANLSELIEAEDFSTLYEKINVLTLRIPNSGEVNSLEASCRFLRNGRDYIIYGSLKRGKTKFGKSNDYIHGVIANSAEMKYMTSDADLTEARRSEMYRFSAMGDIGITEIVGKDLLSKIQIPLTVN
ncbi:MAG: hypothetical protein FWF82_06080, partial [Oscillospiraceae bacterium]|nr:hypothetical protein [Oscillospiraceae bacterium]